MNGSRFLPLHEVPRSAVEVFLRTRGVEPAVIDWKYFDSDFNSGQPRGYVWSFDGVVRGFVGLIPYVLVTPGGPQRAAWTCDWALETPDSAPGMGILLYRKVAEAQGWLTALGGNEVTRRMLPRMATHTVEGAANVWHKPVRTGIFLRKLGGRIGQRLARTRLGQLPLSTALRRRPRGVEVANGVAEELAPFLSKGRLQTGPQYELDYVRWQIARCPVLRAMTFWSSDSCAALAWHPLDEVETWRATMWLTGDPYEAPLVLTELLRTAGERGAAVVSLLSSPGEKTLNALLRRAGFLRARAPRPLYLFAPPGAEYPSEFARHSWLDTDLAYRF